MSEVKVIDNKAGISVQSGNIRIFFGNASSDLNFIKNEFSFCRLSLIKQVHGTVVIDAPGEGQEADAQVSNESQLALLILTADCLPIMIFDRYLGCVAAVHAGWRGVAGGVLLRTIEKMLNSGSSIADLIFYVGPHINQESFEVDVDVKERLLESLLTLSTSNIQPAWLRNQVCYEARKNGAYKYHLNLYEIIKYQIMSAGGLDQNIKNLNIDTVSDNRWHSFRRDPKNAGRNISLIYRS